VSCEECRGHITVLHPDDKPINAFRELFEKLAEEIGGRKEAREIADQIVLNLNHGSPQNLRYLEALEEAGENL